MATVAMNAQTNCDDANSYLVNAYSHVKDAYDSNNISHLKYYANRSVESFKLSKKTLISCGCKTALDLANKGIYLLAKIEHVETFEDGRFYVKRARDISKESVIEIDKCALVIYHDSDSTAGNEVLSDLENEQLLLKKQQEALKLKEKQIKSKLAEQKEKELKLKKEQLILSYNSAITSNIKTYNDVLKICNCKHEAIENIESSVDVSTKSVEDIRNFYTNNLKKLASNYLSELNSCH
ncbi:hypothetical protein GCM10023314_31170 [Algibacter agarivorans]|uniref:Uncharacterized protein n=2 Tax=Algibacter agarivorans TaxID=1109741 RepID=A0ABP9GWY5_9FLAO